MSDENTIQICRDMKIKMKGGRLFMMFVNTRRQNPVKLVDKMFIKKYFFIYRVIILQKSSHRVGTNNWPVSQRTGLLSTTATVCTQHPGWETHKLLPPAKESSAHAHPIAYTSVLSSLC